MTSPVVDGLARWQARVGRDGSCHAERDRFLAFCAQYGLPATAEAVALYLVHLLDSRSRSLPALRYRLRLLDLAAGLAGEPLPSRDPGLRLFLRGLRRSLATGVEQIRTPLYVEDVDSLLHAVDRDRLHQLRDEAFVLLADATPVPSDVLRQLHWHQLRLRRNELVLTLPEKWRARGPRGRLIVPVRGGPTCPVEAMRRWSRHVGPANGYVFTTRAGLPLSTLLAAQLLVPLPGRAPLRRGGSTPADVTVLLPYLQGLAAARPRELRDKAAILLAFAACLTSEEARQLRVGHVSSVPEGLLLLVPGRSDPVGVPRGRMAYRCPVSAWAAWVAALSERDMAEPDQVAFPRIQEQAISNKPLDGYGPTWLVKRRCEQAGLYGDYGFTSLRIGFIRTAARAGVPEQVILRQAGLSRLDSVLLHVTRERLISHSVAAQVGL